MRYHHEIMACFAMVQYAVFCCAGLCCAVFERAGYRALPFLSLGGEANTRQQQTPTGRQDRQIDTPQCFLSVSSDSCFLDRQTETTRRHTHVSLSITNHAFTTHLGLGVTHHHHPNERSEQLQGAFLLGGERLAHLLLPETVVLKAERPHL